MAFLIDDNDILGTSSLKIMRIVESLQLTGTDRWYEHRYTWKYFCHDKIPLDGETEKAKAHLSMMDLSKEMHFTDATTVFHMGSLFAASTPVIQKAHAAALRQPPSIP